MTKMKKNVVTKFTCRLDRAIYWALQGGLMRPVGALDVWYRYSKRETEIVDELKNVVCFGPRDFNRLWEVQL